MSQRVRVLLVAAGARGDGLALDEELRAIHEGLAMSRFGDAIDVVTRPAARPMDLADALMRHQPTVLHLSGRGTPEDGLLLRADDGGEVPVDPDGLAKLLEVAAPQLRLVVITACWTEPLARTVAEVVGCAIGIRGVIADAATAALGRLLYTAIGHGYPVAQAAAITAAALQMHGVRDHDAIAVAHAAHVDPAQLFVIPAHFMPSGPRDALKPHADTTLPLLTKTIIAVVTVAESPDNTVTEAAVRACLDPIGQVRRVTIRRQ